MTFLSSGSVDKAQARYHSLAALFCCFIILPFRADSTAVPPHIPVTAKGQVKLCQGSRGIAAGQSTPRALAGGKLIAEVSTGAAWAVAREDAAFWLWLLHAHPRPKQSWVSCAGNGGDAFSEDEVALGSPSASAGEPGAAAGSSGWCRRMLLVKVPLVWTVSPNQVLLLCAACQEAPLDLDVVVCGLAWQWEMGKGVGQ